MQATRLFTILLASFFFSATSDSLAAQTITHVPLYTFHGDSPGDNFGLSVSGAGDVNGDGMADLIVGVRLDDTNASNGGNARVFSGSDGNVMYNFYGDGVDHWFGLSVSEAGDVDGDGKADMIVGSRLDDTNGDTRGSARVLSGSDGSVLYNFDGVNAGDRFGESVSGAGDVNGDGMADMIVGADLEDSNGDSSGRARVLSGSDGSVLYNFDGDSANDSFGNSVSGAGDVNGDGFADLIVGAVGDDNISRNGGSARVLSGSDGSVLHTFDGDRPNDQFGFSVSGAGDVDGDGKADLIVGARFSDFNGTNSGLARVLSGSDGSILYVLEGDNPNDLFGSTVSGAGDVNGDGKADLIVGALQDDNNGIGSGNARVISGSDGSILYSFDGDMPNDNFGVSVSGAGDVNGDGIDDFIVGAENGGTNFGGYARVFVSQISAPVCVLGDVDLSGSVDFLDIQPFIAALSGGANQCEADCDQSGMVDFLDIQPFIAILSSQ